MIASVLIPADLCEESDLVIDFAAGLDALGVRRAVVGHSVEATGLEGPVIVASVDRAREALRGATVRLDAAGIQAEVRVVTGDPAEAMIALASEAHVDAIVVGTHGKKALDRLFARSISEDLLAHTDRPVIFCRFDLLDSATDPAEVARGICGSILLPTDFSEPSKRAFELAVDLPKDAVGGLRLVHVLEPALTGDVELDAEHAAEVRLAQMVEEAQARGLSATSVVRRGEPGPEILGELAEYRASGVVTGSRGYDVWAEAVLGSVSLTLLRQAPCPVLVVP